VSGALGSNSRVLKVPRGVVSTLVTLSRFVPLPVYPDQLASLEAPKPAPVGDPARDLGFSPRSLEEALSR
jgi:hypothetical protein